MKETDLQLYYTELTTYNDPAQMKATVLVHGATQRHLKPTYILAL
jgi:hypothetical protein